MPNSASDILTENFTGGGLEITVAVAIAEPRLRAQVLEALQKFSPATVREDCSSDQVDRMVAAVERVGPSIVLLGVDADPLPLLSRFIQLKPAPPIVAVAATADPETILKAIRAGAAEFVYPPFEEAFAESLRRVIANGAGTPANSRINGGAIGFVSAKGACGSTTLACHAARHLKVALKKEILLADLDMWAGVASALMRASVRYTLDDAVQNLHRMDPRLWKALAAQTPSGVDLIAASPDSAASLVPVSRKLPQLLSFWRSQYEITVLDLGHGITPSLLALLDSLDTLVLVATNELLSLRQARYMIQALALRNVGANRLKLVINRMPRRTSIPLPELENIMGHPIHHSIPNDYPALEAAYSEPRLLHANTPVALSIGELAMRLAGVVAESPKKRGLFAFRTGK